MKAPPWERVLPKRPRGRPYRASAPTKATDSSDASPAKRAAPEPGSSPKVSSCRNVFILQCRRISTRKSQPGRRRRNESWIRKKHDRRKILLIVLQLPLGSMGNHQSPSRLKRTACPLKIRIGTNTRIVPQANDSGIRMVQL